MRKIFKQKKITSAVVAMGLSWMASSQVMAEENHLNNDGQTYNETIFANEDVSITDIYGDNITVSPLADPDAYYGINLASAAYEPGTWNEIGATTIFGNNLTVSTTDVSTGILVNSSNTGIFGDHLTISAKNEEGWGVRGLEVNFGGKVQIGDNFNLTVSSGDSVIGNNVAIATTSSESIQIGDNAYIGSDGWGLSVTNEYSEDSTNVSFGKNAKIDVKAGANKKDTNLAAVYMNVASNGKYKDGDQTVSFGDNASITVDAGTQNNAKAIAVGGANSFLIFDGQANIQAKATGVYDEETQTFKGGNAVALEFSDDDEMSTWGVPQSQAEFKGNTTIVAEGTNQVAGVASVNAATIFHGDANISVINHGSNDETQNGGYTRAIALLKQDQVVFEGNANINVVGNGATGIYINDQYTAMDYWTGEILEKHWDLDNELRSNEESSVVFNGNVSINAEKAIDLQMGGVVTSKVDANGQVIGGGKYLINGDMFASGDRDDKGIVSKIDLMMTNNSVFTGAANAEGANAAQSEEGKAGVIKLNLNNSLWNMIADSNITSLNTKNSTVNFTQDLGFKTLMVEDLSGSSTFKMSADVVGSNTRSADVISDKLIVTNSVAGKHNVIVANKGSAQTTGKEVLTLIETPDGNAEFNMTQKTEFGGYLYGLRQSGNNWELYSSGQEISSGANTSANFLNVGYMLNYAETQTLLQRMGELRQDGGNAGGDVWVRAFTGKFDSFGGGKLSGFDMDYTGVQAGVDKRLNIDDADAYLGVMGGTSKANSNYQTGDGDVTGYHFGLYGSYVTPNDFYVDTVLKYSHFKNSFNISDSQYNQINGSASSGGYGLSIETGKRFFFDEKREGFYVEPQAQLSYAHQGGASSTDSSGLKVEMDSYDSTLARVSGIVGYEVKNGKNPINVYVKTGYVKEMSGDVGYRLNGNQEKYDFGGDWWENGVGVNAQINKKHNLYLDGTYATGSKFDQMQINAGYRYVF